MIREVLTIHRLGNGHDESLELSCGHSKELRRAEVDKLAERAAKERSPLTTTCTLCDDAARGYPLATEMLPIPIAAAKRIAEEYGYDQVVIYGRRCHSGRVPSGEHLTTYGKSKEHCSVAGRIGDTLKRIMGWNV